MMRYLVADLELWTRRRTMAIADTRGSTALDKARLLDMYERMVQIRTFEDTASKKFADGKMPGFVHLYAGEEAVAVGVCTHLTDKDYITSTHRGHGHCIAKGVDIDGMVAELMGKATGSCKGKGGSMHIADVDKGMLGANGIVGGGLPLACGAAAPRRGPDPDRGQDLPLLWPLRGRHDPLPHQRGARLLSAARSHRRAAPLYPGSLYRQRAGAQRHQRAGPGTPGAGVGACRGRAVAG